jgi:hypothetical protein
VSGHCDSIREWRARESWENGGREEETPITTTSLGLLAAMVFVNPEEAEGFIYNVLTKRLDLEYITWNGRTDMNVTLR